MIPLATHTITVQRPDLSPDVDPYDEPTAGLATVVSGVRAVISTPSAQTTLVAGDRVVTNATMRCDPCDLCAGDFVTDQFGLQWTALNVVGQDALGLSFLIVNLRRVVGAS